MHHRPIIGRNNFDFLRFALATLVVYSHSFPLATGNEDHEPLAVLTGHQLTFGVLAVDCFFIISGYLISQSWVARPSVGAFLRKRVARIYPGFVVATLLGAFVVVPLFSYPDDYQPTPKFVAHFLGQTLRLLEAVPGPAFKTNPAPGPVNGSLWSISYEFWCYIGVLLSGRAGWLMRRKLIWAAFFIAILTSFVFRMFELHPGGSFLGLIFGYPPLYARLLPFFLVGMAFHSLRGDRWLHGRGVLICGLGIIVASFVPQSLQLLLPFTAAYILFWLAVLPIPYLSNFARHGDFSYGVYLYSFPLLQIVVALYGSKIEPLRLFMFAWPLSVAAGFLSWHLVERPFVRKKSGPHLEATSRPRPLSSLQR